MHLARVKGSRETVEVTDIMRTGLSIWNRREGAKDARHIEAGDTAALTVRLILFWTSINQK